MIWLFWGLLGTILGGMLLLAILARRGRSKLRPARPTTWQFLRAAGNTFVEVLWSVSHPFGVHGRPGHFMDDSMDASKDYVREREHQLEEQRQHSQEKYPPT
jgi:hypothetical protein